MIGLVLRFIPWALWVGLAGMVFWGGTSCNSRPTSQVVVYTALDEEFSQPLFDRFTRQTGFRVLAKFDTESTKTVGLTQAIMAERARPRCDVFWNNEIVNTLRLEQAGLLQPYNPLQAESFPQSFRSSRATWHGFAARARVLLVNTRRVPKDAWPTSVEDLVSLRWKGIVGMAKPLAGTTASHAACLFAVWGDARAQDFFRRVKTNAQILSGNKQVARAVSTGQLAFGLTDTDDAIIELESGRPVAIVYPDQPEAANTHTEALGTLFIPNTVAIISGAPHQQAAQSLVDFLLSPATERQLAAGPSAQIPLNRQVGPLDHEADPWNRGEGKSLRVETPETIQAMKVDFQVAAEKWETAARFLRDQFATAD
jgi:iron(III) transport system substrate-binding protein